MANSHTAYAHPVMITRVDKEYLLMRGGSTDSLQNKNILLLGCGSVGGFIANDLCQSGVCSVDILDKDILSADNVYRHFLGFDMLKLDIYENKADLMKQKLESMYPYVDIDSLSFVNRTVEALLDEPNRLNAYDLIISALGEPTINLAINEVLRNHAIRTPFICAFNEPYGIGGHAVAVNIENDSCLQCLYTDVSSSELVSFRGSLVQPGQNFKKSYAGCGGAFVPYSGLDSQQTAITATRLAIDIFAGNITQNTICSWFGDDQSIITQGYATSAFYKQNRTSGYSSRMSVFPSKHCNLCHRDGVKHEE